MYITNFIVRSSVLVLTLVIQTVYAAWDPTETQRRENEAQQTINRFKESDKTMQVFFDKAYGYAVFSNVGKGAVGIGGAFGKGSVYHKHALIGYTTLSQVTIGFQLGGQAYSEIIFFENKEALENFKNGKLKFAAQASAVAATAGAAASAAYNNGVAVFTIAKAGLMYEASIGGQGFSFEAIEK